MREGVTPEMAQRNLTAISARIFPLWQSSFSNGSARFIALGLRESMVGGTARPLRLLAAAVLLVLLVAIANIATLALVRISAREHELATRARLGASRLRLVRLVVTENLLAVLLAGLAGVALAAAALRLASAFLPGLPRVGEVSLDGRAVAFAALATLAAALLVSVAPAGAVIRGRLLDSRADGRRMSAGRRANAVRSALVAAEFMLALPLLATAALLGRSFLNLQHVRLGFDPSHAFTIPVSLPEARYADSTNGVLPTTAEFWQRAVQRAREAPGVVAAAVTTSLPPNNGGDVNNFNLLDHPVPPGSEEPVAPWSGVSTDYFAALGIPLLDGRLFSASDTANGPPVAIVSRAWAARHFPGRSVLGQQFISGGCTTCPPTVIVGVVGDVKYLGLAGSGEGMYAPIAQEPARGAQLVIRTAGPPASAMGPVIATLRSVDPGLPLAGRTMDDRLRSELSSPGRWTILLGAFAAVALGLAALGIFGLMSYLVRRQRREIGVRMALGAEPGAVARMIVRRGMRCVAPGLAGGVLLMLVAARWTESLLYGVAPRDPPTIAAVTAVLLASAAAACLLPGARAARIRPAEAIASE
jgi:putative ABC transport system permease protein